MLNKTLLAASLATLLAAPALSYASQYPLTVTDLDGKSVTLQHEPQRIILQDGRDLMTLALLDRQDPFARVVAWNNLAKRQDTATWDLLKKRWPKSASILDMGFSDKGQVDLESVIAQKPDLMIAQLRAKPALIETGVISKLQSLNVPVLFVDYEINPAKDTVPSITLLGKVLNREDHARAYTDFYQQHYQAIEKVVAAQPHKAKVFVEPIAGVSGDCCFTHGHSGWGGLIEAVGAENIGSSLLPGASGTVALEQVISMKPDTYIMTGSKRSQADSPVLPLGYTATTESVTKQAKVLLSRTGLAQVPAIAQHQVYGIYHPFYNHPYNIVGMEYLAKAIYPTAFKQLDADASYHYIIKNFTTLPDDKFVFFWHE